MNIRQPKTLHTSTLNWSTPEADVFIAYLARHSSPKNQERTIFLNDKINGLEEKELNEGLDLDEHDELIQAYTELNNLTTSLIEFCAEQGHWSVFEQASMSVTIFTTRAISAQILRHSNLKPQEFSQRYASVQTDIETPEIRFTDGKKRNPSVVDDERGGLYQEQVSRQLRLSQKLYNNLLNEGVHPESARNVLPLCTPTILSLNGNLRDWFFYIQARTSSHAQKEHQQVAESVKKHFKTVAPLTYKALF